MYDEPDVTVVASLLGDKTRSKMVMALMSGKALTASELALEADVTCPTASSHLSRLLAGHLVVVHQQGRHRYYRINGEEVAQFLESLLNLSQHLQPLKKQTGPPDPALRKARVCYNHLAGDMAVRVFDALSAKDFIACPDDQYTLTPEGMHFFSHQGFQLSDKDRKKVLCKQCMDWSERRFHLAGVVGSWILTRVLSNGWARRDPLSRAVIFSAQGERQFNRLFFLDDKT